MRYVLKIAYDGTHYAGWQCQKNAPTVQEELEKAIEITLGKRVRVVGSGRTDAGVHAVGQTCHFDLDVNVPPEKMPDCLNKALPVDIRAVDGWGADENFDSNKSAKRKTYCYSLYVAKRENPLKERYQTRIKNAPNIEILQEKAKLFEGEHDFKAFCASGSSVKTTVRTVYEVKVEETQKYQSRDIKIYVTGNGFLYNMVRTMVGELFDLANGKRTDKSLFDAYESGDRSLLGKTMPAKGLTLIGVEYANQGR